MTSPKADKPITVALAADEGFAMPLAATVRSVLDTVGSDRTIAFHILDGGITDDTKARLLSSWKSDRAHRFDWVQVDPEIFKGIKADGHVNQMTYYRMLIPRVIPDDVERVIYLDADLIVRRDLGVLWDTFRDDCLCLAAQDPAAPFIDASKSLSNIARCATHLAAVRPIVNYEALGLSATNPYFNGGILVMNLSRWRQEDISGQLVDCLRRNQQFVLWWDQYALNVVLCGRWTPLDVRWNQGSHIFHFPSWKESPHDESTFQTLKDDPYIVHFTSPVKPWHFECRHPYRQEWFGVLDRTEWKGWRPAPLNVFQRVYRAGYWKARETVRRTLRRVQILLGGRRLK